MIVTLCSLTLWSASALLAADSTGDIKTGMDVGQRHPDFELPTLDGRLARLSDFHGKKVVLIHFASW